MSEAFILSAVRTPVGIGKRGGGLSSCSPINLGAMLLEEVIKRSRIKPEAIDDVIWGCVTQKGDQGANLGRLTALRAGIPPSVPAVTINRMCGSSQQAIHFAAQAILSGDMDLVIAGGTEMMSHEPIGSDWPEEWPSDFPYALVHQGESAELMAQKWNLDREALDDFAYQSHWRAMAAIQKGYFDQQIMPVPLQAGGVMTTDEGVRIPPDREKMRALRPAFKSDGVITAGNSSQISDGAAAVVVVSPKLIGRYNLIPRAKIIGRVVVGSDPVLMLDGPIHATKLVLERTGLSLEDMDVIEINEAFASVVLAWQTEFQADMGKVNPNGGAIALGHPTGATGGILMTKLLHELERMNGRYGLQTMCIGHGMATATIIERI
ncbi:MAG: thiolase family protein [Anaerolineales bacterium]